MEFAFLMIIASILLYGPCNHRKRNTLKVRLTCNPIQNSPGGGAKALRHYLPTAIKPEEREEEANKPSGNENERRLNHLNQVLP